MRVFYDYYRYGGDKIYGHSPGVVRVVHDVVMAILRGRVQGSSSRGRRCDTR